MIDRQEAARAIADIEAIREATRRSIIYRITSEQMVLWGAIVAIANLLAWFFRPNAGRVWLAMTLLGVAASLYRAHRRGRQGYGSAWRLAAAFALFFGFGAFWTIGVGHFDGRQLSVFWPTFVMFGYALAGLWLGATFIAMAVGLSVLIAAGYFLLGPSLELFLAFANGGGLIACGLWMQRG